MGEKMTEEMKARIRKFAHDLIYQWCLRGEGTGTLEADSALSGKWAIDNFPKTEDPDTELMREVWELLKVVNDHAGCQYSLQFYLGKCWAILKWDPDREEYVQLDGDNYTPKELHDKLKEMIPHPIPTLMECPDAKLMWEVVGLLNAIHERTSRRYYLLLNSDNLWAIIRRTPQHEGYTNAFYESYTLEQLRDKLKELLPPPVPTVEKAAEAFRKMDKLYRESNAPRIDGDSDKMLKLIAGFFEAETKRRAEGDA